jgi:gamma-glutamylcyclotransferase (GGCT)/AIG2-like uncharacterized protein YtfP
MLLFVYGDLRDGQAQHHLLEGSKFLGKAHTPPGYLVIESTGRDAMIPQGSDPVRGELYDVPPKVLSAIDTYEDPYRRRPINLTNGIRADYYAAPDYVVREIQEGLAEADQINRNWLPQVVPAEGYGSPERIDWLLGRGAKPPRGHTMDAKTRNEVISTLRKMKREDLVRYVTSKANTGAAQIKAKGLADAAGNLISAVENPRAFYGQLSGIFQSISSICKSLGETKMGSSCDRLYSTAYAQWEHLKKMEADLGTIDWEKEASGSTVTAPPGDALVALEGSAGL